LVSRLANLTGRSLPVHCRNMVLTLVQRGGAGQSIIVDAHDILGTILPIAAPTISAMPESHVEAKRQFQILFQ
jgi:hypothetical protein